MPSLRSAVGGFLAAVAVAGVACGGGGGSSGTPAPSGLAYAANPAHYTAGEAITPNTPTSAGGPVASYAVRPALPAGLGLDGATGVISGTPTAASPAATYSVTARNSGGEDTVSLRITVDEPPPRFRLYATAGGGLGGSTLSPTLIGVDPRSGAQVEIATTGLASAQSALAWDPSSGKLFGLDSTTHAGVVTRIDPDTGEATLAATTSTLIAAIAFSPAGQLYLVSGAALMTCELPGGATSPVGTLLTARVHSLAFCGDGTLLAVTYDGERYALVTVDPGTAAVRSTLLVPSDYAIEQIACAPDGYLYASNYSWTLLRVDPRTGEAIPVGPGQLGALGGLALVPDP